MRDNEKEVFAEEERTRKTCIKVFVAMYCVTAAITYSQLQSPDPVELIFAIIVIPSWLLGPIFIGFWKGIKDYYDTLRCAQGVGALKAFLIPVFTMIILLILTLGVPFLSAVRDLH